MSWALFWFLCVVGLSLVLSRALKQITLLTAETRRLRIYNNGFARQNSENIEIRFNLKRRLEKYRGVVQKMQRGLSKCRADNLVLKADLAAVTKERNQLKEQVDNFRSHRPSVHLN